MVYTNYYRNKFAKFLSFIFVFLPVFLLPRFNLAPPIVQAVLFYSPSCPHCHDVIENVLPPLVEKYPNQLDIIGIDVSNPTGLKLYQTAIEQFKIPESRLGVPTLIVASEVLVGTDEIAIMFPQIVENGLTKGGIAWPAIPGLAEILAAQAASTSQATPVPEPAPVGGPVFLQRFMQDPFANSIATIVLIGMIVCAAIVLSSYLKGPEHRFASFAEWLLPAAALLGTGVALYMSYVELTKTYAICGPVGNCNTVQESPFAYLFGFLPVGVVGVIGYLAILVAWLLKRYGPAASRKFFTIAIWAMAWVGILFAIYLTFLEPFIIGATCAWCITDSIVISAILLFSTQPAKEALAVSPSEFLDDSDANTAY